MKLFVIAFLLPLFLLLFNFPLRFCLKGDSCNVLRVIFSGHSCTLDSKTYQKMISTTENYLCENVSFLGSTLKKHYFLAKDNKITTYIHDNDINQKEIDGFDLKDYTVIKATVGENKILLEAVNIAKKDKRYTIVLSNFEAEKINARVYELGNVNLTLCILLCNHFYVIIAEEQKLVQKHFKFNANDELEEVVENVLSNYNENIAKIDTTDSFTIKVNTESDKIDHINMTYDNPSETTLPMQITATLLPSLLQEESSDIIKISKSSLINIGMGLIIIALTIVLIIHCYKTRPTNSTNDTLHPAPSKTKMRNGLPHDRGTNIAFVPLMTNQTNRVTDATRAENNLSDTDTSLAPS